MKNTPALQRVTNDLLQGRKFALVLHESPDYDCLVCAFVFLFVIRQLATKLGIGNIDTLVSFLFTPIGTQYTGEIPAYTTLVHADTGKEYDEEKLLLDHHLQDGTRNADSSARLFWNAFIAVLKDYPLILKIVEHTDIVDSGGQSELRERESALFSDFKNRAYKVLNDTRAKICQELEELNGFCNGSRMTFVDKSFPETVIASYKSAEAGGEYDDLGLLKFGLELLDNWYREEKVLASVADFLRHCGNRVDTEQRINVMHYPEVPYAANFFRGVITQQRAPRVDLFLTRYMKQGDKQYGKLGLTKLNRNIPLDLRTISERLKVRYPDLVFYAEDWVLYVVPTDNAIELEMALLEELKSCLKDAFSSTPSITAGAPLGTTLN